MALGNSSFHLIVHTPSFLVDTPIHHEDNDMNHFVVVVGIPNDSLAHHVVLKNISMDWSAQDLQILGVIPSHH